MVVWATTFFARTCSVLASTTRVALPCSGLQLRSISPAHTCHRKRDVIVLQQCRTERLLHDIVGDNHSRRAASGRSGSLIGEVAATAINQDHRARDRQAVVVGALTARVCRPPETATSGPVTPAAEVAPLYSTARAATGAPSTVNDSAST